MKQFITLFLMLLGCWSAYATSGSAVSAKALPLHQAPATTVTPGMSAAEVEAFLTLTPKKYREMTGKRLGLKKSLQLKIAQKMVKHAGKKAPGDIPIALYIVLAIFGLAWIAMGVMDNWSGTNWWLNLILVLLFYLPGLIHALIVMGNYY